MTFRNAYGYEWSENGWRMCNRDECDLVRIPDLFLTETAPLRRGAPLTILGAWMKWYDTHVEEIGSNVWGWSALNDVPNSNHLSGTAIDLNAPKYPWGERVMPADRRAKVREGLRLFEGTVFWGADWQRADEMHYQMNFGEGDARNEAFAQKLRNGHLGIYGTPAVQPKGILDMGNVVSIIDKQSRTPEVALAFIDYHAFKAREAAEAGLKEAQKQTELLAQILQKLS
ncbi:putative endolysin [Rhodococcus phage Toil]|uniref:Putative endolysin n=1 Tax=Rhodococcus phage Toil TaxID=1975614 RepID=A0A1W6DXS2_9VIRU|nr:endolysin [Rhodococcus phage Toil]ARK07714.1 putative endolysin [Rhodococcus phage Toil]